MGRGLRDLCLMGRGFCIAGTVLRMLTYFKQEIEAENGFSWKSK